MNALTATAPVPDVAARSLFERLAESAWGWVGDARKLELGFSEDTISDLAMLEIARSGLGGLKVGRVSKREERFVGFDWLWIISRPGHPTALYVVQAKKMKLDKSQAYSYSRIRYRTGSKYQIDALEDFADWMRAFPMYCFYNNVDRITAGSRWNCRVQKKPDAVQMGCTLVPSGVVRRVHDVGVPKNFRSVHQHPQALPWRCLFHRACHQFSLANTSRHAFGANGVSAREWARELMEGLPIDDDGLIDRMELINRLGLDDLVKRYASGSFIPIPERIVYLRVDD